MTVVIVHSEIVCVTNVFDCVYVVFGAVRITTAISFTSALRCAQALIPSRHVCGNFPLPAAPHWPCHAPPCPQQVGLPFLVRPHFGHSEQRIIVALIIIIVICRLHGTTNTHHT